MEGDDANVQAAQKALLHRAKCNSAASKGQYSEEVEKMVEPAFAGYGGAKSELSSQD